MAIIGSIRKQSGLLIILVGAAMVLFILSDLMSSGGGMFSSREVELGAIRGHEITQREFELMVQEEIDQRYGPEGAPEQARESIRQRIWQKLLQEYILFEEYHKLGISVSPDELLDQVKNTQPGSVLYQYFTDPQTGQIIEQFRDPNTGGLNAQMVLSAIQNLLNSENASDWIPIEKAIKQDRMFNKYMTLVSKGLTATGHEAKQLFEEKNAKRTFEYALREYTSIPDDEIEVTESDLEAYYDKHKDKKRFHQPEEMRSLDFIVFEVFPSEADLREIEEDLVALKPLFEADSNDTAFVAENSDSPVQANIRAFKAENLPPSIRDTVVNSETGTVFGPYEEGGSMNISKLSKIKYAPDSVRARHILIKVQEGDTAALSGARAKLDSLKTVIGRNNNFEALASEYSEDLGSAAKGGDLDWFGRGRMVPPFEKACFEGEIGDMPIVESQFGVHLIEITDQSEDVKLYVMATVDRALEPSKETTDEVYRKASAFAIENNTPEKFRTNGEPFGIQNAGAVRIVDENIGTLSNARAVVRWAFEAEKGSVSEPFEIENSFVIASVSNVRPKGQLPLEAVKAEIEQEVIREKKAERIISELGDYASVHDAATAWGTEVQVANDAFFHSASLPGGLGREMKVLGAAFALEQGEVSEPVKGNRGVFVISVTKVTPPASEPDLAAEKSTATSDLANRAERTLYQALQENADIEDNRGRYY